MFTHPILLKNTIKSPLDLLNKIFELKLGTVFPYICMTCRIFCTLPVTVASAEQSFSPMARVKNALGSTLDQERLAGLGVLAIQSEVARSLNFSEIIAFFAEKKARNVPFSPQQAIVFILIGAMINTYCMILID